MTEINKLLIFRIIIFDFIN